MTVKLGTNCFYYKAAPRYHHLIFPFASPSAKPFSLKFLPTLIFHQPSFTTLHHQLSLDLLPPSWCGTSPTPNMATPTSEPSTKEIIIGQVIDALGEHALDTVSPSDKIPSLPRDDSSPEDDFFPHCITQQPIPRPFRGPGAPHNIMVGLEKECPRWAPGSVIRWYAPPFPLIFPLLKTKYTNPLSGSP